ncbi:MAG: hypothetical protein ACRD1H_02675, partial [Vicinamibacterales bacterium]
AGWRGWAGESIRLAGALTAFALVAVVLATVFGGGEPDQRGSGAASDSTATPDAALASEPTTEATPADDQPQPCVDGQVTFDVTAEDNVGHPAINSPSFVGITVTALKSTGGVECRLTTPVSLAITGADGTPLDIAGSPATATLDAVLGAGEASVSFAWFNWCGAPGPFSLEVALMTSSNSGSGMGQSLDVAPNCDDVNQPSKLGQAAAAQTVPTDGTCQATEVVMTSSDLQREGDDVLIWVVSANLAGCSEGERVTVTLTDDAGEPLAFDGNGSDLMLKANTTGEYVWAGLVWSNWCGVETGFNLDVVRADSGSSSWVHVVPGCEDASQPSRMT